MERIAVPFLKKNIAVSLGAVFSREDRFWYIPEDISDEAAEKLRNLDKPEETPVTSMEEEFIEDTDTSGHTYMLHQYYEESEQIPIESTVTIDGDFENNSTHNENGEFFIKSYINDHMTTLEAALYVYQHGMPSETEQRILLLKAMSQRALTQYPITYDGILQCCPDFAQRYPQEYLSDLCKRCITGARHFTEDIRISDLTEEEKALLYFALPL